MSKRKRSLKIFIYGILTQLVTLIFGLVVPRLFIVGYGSELNGLLSSIRQVFVYIALLEAGIGTASLHALYGPVANDNKKAISAIMVATDKFYKRTGFLYGLCVIVFSIVYVLVIKSEIPAWIIIIVILLQGMKGVINFLFYGKFSILLRADGKSYITSNLATMVNILGKFAQIFLILNGFNIIVVETVILVISISQMFYIYWYTKKHYSWLDFKEEPDYNALQKSKNVLVHQISWLIFNNTDVLVLSFFCGLKVVSVYALYNLIMTYISSIIETSSNSIEFILGQAFKKEREVFNQMYEVYETYYLGVVFSLFTITLVMFPSFIGLYTRGITDANYVDPKLLYLFVSMNLLRYTRQTSDQVIYFAEHFKETQYQSILESVINVAASLFLVTKIGMYGVLIGTIIALLYRSNDIIIYANLKIFHRMPWNIYRKIIQNIAVMFLVLYGAKALLPEIHNYFAWVGCSAIVGISSMAVFFLIDSVMDQKNFKVLLKAIRKKANK